MAKPPGLFQRNGVWTLRVMIPLELQPSYAGRAKLIESLKTRDSAQAKVRGTLRRAELLEEFQRKRLQLNPQRVKRVTPDMARLLAERSGQPCSAVMNAYGKTPHPLRSCWTPLRPSCPAKACG